MSEQPQNLRTVLPQGILSYPHLFEASAVKNKPDAKKRFGCQILVPLSTDISELQTMVMQAANAKFPNFAANGYPQNFRWPFVKGAAMKPGDPFYADKWVISTARQEKQGRPALVYNDPARTEIVNQADLYAGCQVIVHVGVFAYDEGTPGVSLALNGVLKVADGDRLDNQPTADEMFGDVPADSQAAVSQTTAPGTSAGASPGAPMPWETGGAPAGGQADANAAGGVAGKMPWE